MMDIVKRRVEEKTAGYYKQVKEYEDAKPEDKFEDSRKRLGSCKKNKDCQIQLVGEVAYFGAKKMGYEESTAKCAQESAINNWETAAQTVALESETSAREMAKGLSGLVADKVLVSLVAIFGTSKITKGGNKQVAEAMLATGYTIAKEQIPFLESTKAAMQEINEGIPFAETGIDGVKAFLNANCSGR
jgi:hypothetical protein